MKINWSLRFHNKVWLTTLLAVVCTFVFNLLALFGIETTVVQEQVMQLGAALLSLLSTLGVVIDPTTPGVSDSVPAGVKGGTSSLFVCCRGRRYRHCPQCQQGSQEPPARHPERSGQGRCHDHQPHQRLHLCADQV